MSSPWPEAAPFDAPTDTCEVGNPSGVHEARTEPAPYVEELAGEPSLGSIPVEHVYASYSPLVELSQGRTVGFEVRARCHAEGLTDPQELLARAAFEHHLTELARVVRQQALSDCSGYPLIVSIYGPELKEGSLIRPDNPLYEHDSDVWLSIAMSTQSATCRQVLGEACQRPGIGLILGGFGVGPVTLLDVANLSPKLVMLDPELVLGIERNQRKQIVVSNLVKMMGGLGARVGASGVESQEALRVLRGCGVAMAQGPLFGRPSAVPRPTRRFR